MVMCAASPMTTPSPLLALPVCLHRLCSCRHFGLHCLYYIVFQTSWLPIGQSSLETRRVVDCLQYVMITIVWTGLEGMQSNADSGHL